jgi:hypothetical protein
VTESSVIYLARELVRRNHRVSVFTHCPRRVEVDGVTGFHPAGPRQFAEAAVSLLTDDTLWRRQHEACLRHRQGIDWAEAAARFEAALLSEAFPTYPSSSDNG